MNPVNVLIVEPYPFGKICGNLRLLSFILKYTNKSRVTLHLAVPFESDFVKKVRNADIKCIVIPPHKRLLQYGGQWHSSQINKLLTLLAAIGYNLKLLSILKRKKIDVIYCNSTRSLLYILMAAKIARVPIQLYVKSESQNRILDTIAFIGADKILFQTDSLKNDVKYSHHKKIFNHKIDMLAMGLNFQAIINVERQDKSKIIEELQIDQNKINLVTVGRLYQVKGTHILLEALALIVPQFPDVMLYIVGDPVAKVYQDYPGKLKQIIQRHGLEPYVKFTGWREDALEILSLMDLLVQPSLSEGFGRAVLEAQALGKPVVASRVGGLPDSVQDGEYGFLVPPGDPQALAEKISILLADRKMRETFGRAAREKVMAHNLIEDKIVQLEDIWLELAHRRP